MEAFAGRLEGGVLGGGEDGGGEVLCEGEDEFGAAVAHGRAAGPGDGAGVGGGGPDEVGGLQEDLGVLLGESDGDGAGAAPDAAPVEGGVALVGAGVAEGGAGVDREAEVQVVAFADGEVLEVNDVGASAGVVLEVGLEVGENRYGVLGNVGEEFLVVTVALLGGQAGVEAVLRAEAGADLRVILTMFSRKVEKLYQGFLSEQRVILF